ncbi:MAG: RNA polymerase sigma factor [Planctomycetota bacterium]
MTDRELLRAFVSQSDVASLGLFMSRYQDSLLRFAAKLLGDPDAAQDIVQEAFLRVAKHPARLLEVESCHNWLLRVVRNIGVDHLRRRQRDQRYRQAQVAGAIETHVAGTTDAKESSTERDEVRAQIYDALGQLKAHQRELFLLKVQEEKSYREIAEITGMSVTNVGYQLHQVMRKLSTRLAGLNPGGNPAAREVES